jgi:hypothetical protein
VAVPEVAGLTREAAATALTSAGLVIGTVREADTVTIAARRIIGTIPNARELVSPGSKINLEISSGHDKWNRYVSYGLISAAFLILVALVMNGLSNSGFISTISQDLGARGIITFLIALATIGIALVLVLSNIIMIGEDADRRFDRGKQVLTSMIGILGTIVGFYFATGREPQIPQQGSTITRNQISLTNASLPDAAVNKPYKQMIQVTGGIPPLKWSIDGKLPDGLELAPSTGIIDGTPKAASKTTFKATVTDSATPPNTSTPGEFTLEVK